MLYAIVSDCWVSGVFERESDAQAYLQEIPVAERSKHTLGELDGLQYPGYLVEDTEGFRFLTEQAAVDDIRAHAPTADEDECCATLYRFDRDYRPKVAGEDEMGRLKHEHIDNDVLARVQREGRAGLRIMR